MSPPYSDHLISDLLAAAAPSSADRLLKARQQAEFVREIWITIASVVALLGVVRVCQMVSSLLSSGISPNDKEKGNHTAPVQTKAISLRRLPLSLGSVFRVVAFRWTFWLGPNAVFSLSEFTFISVYLGLILMWTFIDTRNLTIMFWEDRSAHMASSQICLVIALAGKNNVISWITGVSHERLNVLHRAAGRTAFLLLWIHAVQRYLGGLPAKWSIATAGWMQAGVIGLAALTVAVIISVRFIRNRLFEFFLVTHILLIGLFLVGGYLHTKYTDFQNYYWPGFVVWGFDRFLRFARLLWNSRGTAANVELLGSDTIRVTMKRRMNWRAGQHAFIIMPGISALPTEAHPFTIASIPHNIDGSPELKEKDVVLLVRGRTGFTKRLRECAASEETRKVRAFIDGPYGCPPNLGQYTTCVLFAGGSGVSYTLPLLMDLVYRGRQGTSKCSRAVFVWVTRNPGHVKWISTDLMKVLASAPESLTIDARVYVTGHSSASSSRDDVETPTSPIADEKKILELSSYAGVKTEYKRPDIHAILEEEIVTCAGTVSVDVAGPSSLSSGVRKALTSDLVNPMTILKGRAPVVLHVETFGTVKQ